MADLMMVESNGKDEQSRQIEKLLIDLDDTLYQVHEAPELVRENIQGEYGFVARITLWCKPPPCL